MRKMNNASNSSERELILRSNVEIVSLSVSLAIIILLSICGNFLLILAFIRNENLRSAFANKLIMSLAMADFITAVFPLNYQLATVIDVKLISSGGPLCTAGGLASYSFFFISVFTLVMLSVDRFFALGYPLHYSQRMKPKVKVFMIAYPWIHGTLFFVICASIFEIKFSPESLDCGLSWSERPAAFTLTILLIHVGIPLILLIVLNTWTLFLVRAQNRRILSYGLKEIDRDNSTSRDRAQQAYNRRATIESKLAKVSIVIVFVFLVCWTPYVVTRTLDFIGCNLSSGIMSAAAWSVHASSFVNPIIYSSLRADLRRAMLSVFGCGKILKTVPSPATRVNLAVPATSNESGSVVNKQPESSLDSLK